MHPPASFRARPTTDFAKESLFNILANHFDFKEIRVLDLFSGTGSIGYEFASRGALATDMVELREAHVRFIRKTILALELQTTRVFHVNAFVYLRKTNGPYDIVFADPPYDLGGLEELPDLVLEGNHLTEKGWFILEHGKRHSFATHPKFSEERKYGSVNFSIFRQCLSP